jgi:hypothetical protein
LQLHGPFILTGYFLNKLKLQFLDEYKFEVKNYKRMEFFTLPPLFLEEPPGIFSYPMPTEMIIPDTLQSWRIPGGFLAN